MRPGAIYLVSAAGIPNYGDDFITRGWLCFLAKRHPAVEVWVDCPDPGVAATLLARFHPRVHFTDTIWRVSEQHAHEAELSVFREALRERVVALGTPRYDIGLERMRHAASIHFLGGGYLNSIWQGNLGLVFAAAEISRRFAVPLFGTGIGAMPLSPEARSAFLEEVPQFSYFEARDDETADALGAVHGYDDAFLGIGYPGWNSQDPDLPGAMVLIQGDFADDDLRGEVDRVVDMFVRRYAASPAGEGLAFVEAYPPVDGQRWAEYRVRYPAARYFPFQGIWEEGLPLAPGQKWLTTRFHLHLLGAAGGVAGTAINVRDDYYGTKHRSLWRLGTGWQVMDASDLRSDVPLAPNVAADFRVLVNDASRSKEQLARRLYPSARMRATRRIFGAMTRRADPVKRVFAQISAQRASAAS